MVAGAMLSTERIRR